jgi:hypothetical protein
MIARSAILLFVLFVQLFSVHEQSDAIAGHKGPKSPPPLAITGDEPVPVFMGVSPPAPYSRGPGDSIAFTRYDFLSNGSSTRNLVSYGDGTISLGRMGAIVPGHSDRGTFYGCSSDDGITWSPITKIETIRTGWGTIDQFEDAGGACVALSHDATAVTLQAYTDAGRCANTWFGGNTAIPAVWPRIAVGSGVDVHALYGNANPPTSVFYAHSPDGGVTWDNTNVNIFTLAGNLVFADTYNLAAQGSNVAAVSAGYLLNLPGVTGGGDVILATSTDAGATWTEQYVYDIDNNNFTEQDVPDGSSAVAFDPSGNIHVVWSNFYTPGDGSTYYSIDAGIYHWSEATGAHEIILPIPDTLIVPPATGREGNYASAPMLGFDSDGNMFCVYSQFINQKDINDVYYEHVYAAASTDGGATWTEGIDVTPGFGFDAAFPSLAENVGDNLEIVYWSDNLAGNAIRGAHAEQDVAVMYIEVPKSLLVSDPNFFEDDFEAYTAGVQLVIQNNTDWDTWSSLPGSGEDPFVSDVYSFSGANSVVIVSGNDLIRRHGSRTTGSWGLSWQTYIPAGKAGYFNTMSGFTPNPNFWAMEVYYDIGGAGRLITGATTTPFTWTEDTWHLVEVIVDLDQDQAQYVLDGTVIYQWQWTGGGGPLQLDVNDFYGATADDEMYFDDYLFMEDTLRSTTGVGDPVTEVPAVYQLNQNYPNPFNPSTSISYALPEQAIVTLRVYNLLGQEVVTLADKIQEAGVYEVTWNGRNGLGQSVGTGVYFYRFEAHGTSGEVYTDLKKMLFLK